MKMNITQIKQLVLLAMPIIAACLLTNGCSSTKPSTLTGNQLAQLKQTKTVLISVNGVDGKQKEFFVNSFKEQLTINGLSPVITDDEGVVKPDYDAIISLKCYYFDYGHFSLGRSTDLQFAHGPKSATGVGKRIGCRFELTHKALGKVFDGQIQGTTSLQGRMFPTAFKEATSTSEGFSAFLEQNAQQSFEVELKKSQGWLYVLNMRPNG
jgi:hypothetical protein